MKRKTVQKENKSLKTFYLYTVFVFAVIIVALLIKLLLIIQSSKFDGKRHFTVAISVEHKVKEVIAYSPQVPSLAVLHINDTNISPLSLGSNYGIAVDAQIETQNLALVNDDPTTVMWNAIQHYPSIKTNATIIDLFRLTMLSRSIISTNKVIRDITLSDKNASNDTLIARAMNDPTLSSENVSVEVINASNVTGVGQRLGKVLANMGANVVEVSTAQDPQPTSRIEYYGQRSYTHEQIESYLGYPVTEITNQPIANIVIILGEDTKDTTKF